MRHFESFPNLITMFLTRAEEQGDAPFLWRKESARWSSLSWAGVADQVASLSAALTNLGIRQGDRVMLVSENRPEWCISDLAIMAAGAVTVPTYTTNTERDHQHILENSGACAVIVSTEKLARTLMPAVMRSSQVRAVIGIEPLRAGQSGLVDFHDWHALIASETPDVPHLRATATTIGRDDLACIIYTSGTGGAPRGVMQHHGAILHNVAGCTRIIAEDFGWGDEIFLSFLPLSHAYEHTGGQHFPIGLGAQIYYAEGLDKLAANIEDVRPTIMVVVPRLFEVLRQRIVKAIERQGKLPQRMLRRSLKLGAKELNKGLRLWDKPMDFALDRLFRPKVQARFGGRMKAMVSGGAPLNPDIGVFFHSLGLTLLQGYGQTEAAPVIACNRPSAGLKMDTVGPPLPDTEIRIADDGEILVRGELVMKGYWRNELETSRTLIDGWLYTGDIGHLDNKGRLMITDRKKDLIVLDKGDNVSPQKVEGMLTLQPEIGQAMVSGDRRPYLVGLIVPDSEWVHEFAERQGLPGELALLREHEVFRSAVSAAVDRVNRDLSVTEKVRRWIFADEPFTIDNKQLTPSLKIRRHVLREVYGARLDALYR